MTSEKFHFYAPTLLHFDIFVIIDPKVFLPAGALGNPNCPVATFELYLSKLHPNCKALWQRLKDSVDNDGFWYANAPRQL
jgi:hypothetical protein